MPQHPKIIMNFAYGHAGNPPWILPVYGPFVALIIRNNNFETAKFNDGCKHGDSAVHSVQDVGLCW